jgi:hypothetical protein
VCVIVSLSVEAERFAGGVDLTHLVLFSGLYGGHGQSGLFLEQACLCPLVVRLMLYFYNNAFLPLVVLVMSQWMVSNWQNPYGVG